VLVSANLTSVPPTACMLSPPQLVTTSIPDNHIASKLHQWWTHFVAPSKQPKTIEWLLVLLYWRESVRERVKERGLKLPRIGYPLTGCHFSPHRHTHNLYTSRESFVVALVVRRERETEIQSLPNASTRNNYNCSP
jgi:hypothetical protein